MPCIPTLAPPARSKTARAGARQAWSVLASVLASVACLAWGPWAHAQGLECARFASSAPPGVTLSTEAILGDAVRPPGASGGPLLAAHCRVSGRMGERVGIDGKPYHTGFELRLPLAWNGRLLYQGGAATDTWDGLGALVDWVEKGQAPQRILARGSQVFPGRTWPLCAWPQYAHYNGSGDGENAENFSCR